VQQSVVLLDEDDTVCVRSAFSRGRRYAERSLDMLDRSGVESGIVLHHSDANT
jgi:hypothetical protein